jgi:hypothetical protein
MAKIIEIRNLLLGIITEKRRKQIYIIPIKINP